MSWLPCLLCSKTPASRALLADLCPIFSGVLAIAIVAVLIHLHLRRQRMDAKEWTGKNVQELDDYGLSNGSSGPTKPKSTYQADVAHAKSEQPAAKSSIPSGARRSSQDSLRSLEMSLRQQHKPADMV